LAHGTDTQAALARFIEEGWFARHVRRMFAAGGPPRSGLVLGYGAIATDDIDEGLRRLRSFFGG
jgi:DNA-binding transcriptional MocR family regulator